MVLRFARNDESPSRRARDATCSARSLAACYARSVAVARLRMHSAEHAAAVFAAAPLVAIAVAPKTPIVAVFAPVIAVFFAALAVTILHLRPKRRDVRPGERKRRCRAWARGQNQAGDCRGGQCEKCPHGRSSFAFSSRMASVSANA